MTWLPHGSCRSYSADVASLGCQLDREESTIAAVIDLDNRELVLDLEKIRVGDRS